MEIIKEKLAELDCVYAINFIKLNGTDYCIAAGEDRDGKVALINCETKRVQYVDGLSGGIMSSIPIPDEEGALYVIQRFYPVFQSKEAEIVRAVITPGTGDTLSARIEQIIPLPYVHRICLAGESLIAATLCAEKQFEQDWSSPGSVYVIEPREAVPHAIIGGIHKNHGMFVYNGTILITGEEGVFELKNAGGSWTYEKWLSGCMSDLFMYDIDGDGQDELITITPFHGDRLQIFRKNGAEWTLVAEEKLAFGHAVWAGNIDGVTCIIACNRASAKETVLYKVSTGENGAVNLRGKLIDSGVGAANIAVREENGKTVLYAANHGANKVTRYIISQ